MTNDFDEIELDKLEPTRFITGAVIGKKRLAKHDCWNSEENPWTPRQISEYERSHWIRTLNHHGAIGIRPEKFIDWRHLEKRAHAHYVRFMTCSEAYWAKLHELLEVAKLAGSDVVWIFDERDASNVWTYNDQGLSRSRSTSEMIKECIGNPDKKACVVTGHAAQTLTAMYAREATLRSRWGLFNAAFQLAVTERLKHFVRSDLNIKLPKVYNFHTHGVFSISNEGRNYVVTSDQNGAFTWHDAKTKIYRCT